MKNFDYLVQTCTMPNQDSVAAALSARRFLQPIESDFITYLSGFTHFPEAQAVLSQYNLEMLPLPHRLLDFADVSTHFKALIIDESNQSIVNVEDVAEKLGVAVFRNYVHAKNPNNEYVTEFRRSFSGESLIEYNRYLDTLTPRLEEKVIGVPTLNEYNNRVVLHIASVVHRNQQVDCFRLFCNVSYIILFSGTERSGNVSLSRLRQHPELNPLLQEACWLVIGEEHAVTSVAYLNSIGASYILLPEQPKIAREYRDTCTKSISIILDKIGGIVR